MPRAFAISFIQCLWSPYTYMTTVNIQWGHRPGLRSNMPSVSGGFMSVLPEVGREMQNHPQWLSQQLSLPSLGTWTPQPCSSAALSLTLLRMDIIVCPFLCAAITSSMGSRSGSHSSAHSRLCHGGADIPTYQHSYQPVLFPKSGSGLSLKEAFLDSFHTAAMENLARHDLAL